MSTISKIIGNVLPMILLILCSKILYNIPKKLRMLDLMLMALQNSYYVYMVSINISDHSKNSNAQVNDHNGHWSCNAHTWNINAAAAAAAAKQL